MFYAYCLPQHVNHFRSLWYWQLPHDFEVDSNSFCSLPQPNSSHKNNQARPPLWLNLLQVTYSAPVTAVFFLVFECARLVRGPWMLFLFCACCMPGMLCFKTFKKDPSSLLRSQFKYVLREVFQAGSITLTLFYFFFPLRTISICLLMTLSKCTSNTEVKESDKALSCQQLKVVREK